MTILDDFQAPGALQGYGTRKMVSGAHESASAVRFRSRS
jgi:hypothetical protein